MLSNAHFLAKVRFGTADNEPARSLQSFASPRRRQRGAEGLRLAAGAGEDVLDGGEVVLLEREVQRAPAAVIPLERRRLPFIPFQLLKIPQCFLRIETICF